MMIDSTKLKYYYYAHQKTLEENVATLETYKPERFEFSAFNGQRLTDTRANSALRIVCLRQAKSFVRSLIMFEIWYEEFSPVSIGLLLSSIHVATNLRHLKLCHASRNTENKIWHHTTFAKALVTFKAFPSPKLFFDLYSTAEMTDASKLKESHYVHSLILMYVHQLSRRTPGADAFAKFYFIVKERNKGKLMTVRCYSDFNLRNYVDKHVLKN